MTLTQKVNDEEKDREVLWLLKEMVKKAIEEMMKEERVEYLEEHPETKGNGYYLRDLMRGVTGIEDLRVPRTRDGDFRSVFIP
jgi:transposase-like protein